MQLHLTWDLPVQLHLTVCMGWAAVWLHVTCVHVQKEKRGPPQQVRSASTISSVQQGGQGQRQGQPSLVAGHFPERQKKREKQTAPAKGGKSKSKGSALLGRPLPYEFKSETDVYGPLGLVSASDEYLLYFHSSRATVLQSQRVCMVCTRLVSSHA